MRAITIHQPWAELIVRGDKDVENRSWRTRHRGPLLIHAGARADRERFQDYGVPDDARRSAIIGVVEVVDCTLERTSAWHEPGSWGWYLTRAKRFRRPIPMKGRRGLFEVPDRKVASQLGNRKRRSAPRRR
ncbi:MAG TPA: ASCH domain-containing protein [Myxococcaceae bacterium]|nr:ASCH domain-containing protein [Myxococcaceae bacterium]